MTSSATWRALLPALLCVTPACTSWVPTGTPIPLRDSTRLAGKVRLTDSAGVRHVAPGGAIVHGTSVLFAKGNWRADSVGSSSVVLVERSVPNLGGTIGVVVLVGVGMLVALVIVLAATW